MASSQAAEHSCPRSPGVLFRKEIFQVQLFRVAKKIEPRMQLLRHEIQNVDEFMYFLADVRFRAVSELFTTVSLLSPHQIVVVWGAFVWLVGVFFT